MATRDRFLTLMLLSLVYGGITFQQAGALGVCLDIGQNLRGRSSA